MDATNSIKEYQQSVNRIEKFCEAEDSEEVEDSDSEFDYENACDCCCLSWTNEPNEFGICHCWCSTCGDELKICRYKCLDEAKTKE